MKNYRFWLALLVAVFLPTLMVILLYARESLSIEDGFGWIRTRSFAILVFLIASGHVLLLGLPAFLLLKSFNAIRWWSAILTGFVLGCVPVGVLTWPLSYSYGKSSSSEGNAGKMVETMVNGVPTAAGWIRYVEGVAYFGMYGAIAGLGFWLVWRRLADQRPAVAMVER